MGQVAKKYGTTLAKEDLEEVAQEGVMIIAEDLAGYFSGEGIPVSKAELQERAFRLWNTAKESAKAMALLPLPGAVIDARTGGKAMEALPDVVKPEAAKVEEKDPLKKAYVKGFVARIQSIKNNADNVSVGAGNKKKQLKVLDDEIKSLQDSYEKISPVIDENPEALAELKQIRDMLPKYAEAISAFSKKPSKEGYVQIRDISDGITELQQQYGDRIGEQAAKGKAGEALRPDQRPTVFQGDIEGMANVAVSYKTETLSTGENVELKREGSGLYALIDGKEIGFAFPMEEEDFDVAVVEEHQRKDVGTILMREFLELNPQYRTAKGSFTEAGHKTFLKAQIVEQIEPETPDQAIGKQYGLEPAETQTRLDDAEVRYRELKNKPTEKRSKSESKELAFLRRNRTNVEAMLERETSPLENKMPKKEVLKLGHRIPELLGMSELERRDFNRKITGQISMKDMTPAQRQQVVTALGKVAEERGIDMKAELKTSPLGELVAKM